MNCFAVIVTRGSLSVCRMSKLADIFSKKFESAPTWAMLCEWKGWIIIQCISNKNGIVNYTLRQTVEAWGKAKHHLGMSRQTARQPVQMKCTYNFALLKSVAFQSKPAEKNGCVELLRNNRSPKAHAWVYLLVGIMSKNCAIYTSMYT